MLTSQPLVTQPPVHPPLKTSAPKGLTQKHQPIFTGSNEPTNTPYLDPNDYVSVKLWSFEMPPRLLASEVMPKTDDPSVAELVAKQVSKKLGVNAPIFPVNGATMLHAVVSQGNPKVIERLLNLGADPTVQDRNGRTAIDWANDLNTARVSEQTKQEIQDLLSRKPEEPKSFFQSFWPFHQANSPAEPEKPTEKAITASQSEQMANAGTQTDAPTEPSEREQALTRQLDALKLTVNSTQKQLSEARTQIAAQETKLRETREENRQLQAKARGNSNLQSKLQQELTRSRKEKEQFETYQSEVVQRNSSHHAVVSQLQEQNAALTQQLNERELSIQTLRENQDQARNQQKRKLQRELKKLAIDHQQQTDKLNDSEKKEQALTLAHQHEMAALRTQLEQTLKQTEKRHQAEREEFQKAKAAQEKEHRHVEAQRLNHLIYKDLEQQAHIAQLHKAQARQQRKLEAANLRDDNLMKRSGFVINHLAQSAESAARKNNMLADVVQDRMDHAAKIRREQEQEKKLHEKITAVLPEADDVVIRDYISTLQERHTGEKRKQAELEKNRTSTAAKALNLDAQEAHRSKWSDKLHLFQSAEAP